MLTSNHRLHGGARPSDVPTRRADMTRRSPFGKASPPIRRGFEPARSQLRTLAFAFEQALPLVRKNTTNSKCSQSVDSSYSFMKFQSVASGAHR